MEEINVYINDYSSLFNTFDKNDISSEEKDKIIDAVRSHFGLAIKYNLIESKRRNMVNLILLLVGLLILLFKNILPLGNTVFDILDIIACFIIWESAYNLLFTDNESDIKILRAKKISNAKIVFEKS